MGASLLPIELARSVVSRTGRVIVNVAEQQKLPLATSFVGLLLVAGAFGGNLFVETNFLKVKVGLTDYLAATKDELEKMT